MLTPEEAALLKRVDVWTAEHYEEFLEDVKTLVRIRSVCTPDSEIPPFGQGCRDVIDAAMALCEGCGFPAKNHEYYCCTTRLPGKTEKTIGIFNHLDVVPEGNGWDHPPYEPFVTEDGYLFGRGALDNKGSAISNLFALRCLRDLGVRLDHSITFFMGCAEEAGMYDIQYYLAHHAPPDFSYTPDAMYSVCYGEKGILEAQFSRDLSGGNLLDFHGGRASNMVADEAEAVLTGCDCAEAARLLAGRERISCCRRDGHVVVKATGIARHSAFGEDSVNAIHVLAKALYETGLASGPAANAMEFLSAAFEDYYGAGLGLAFEDGVSGKTTCIGGMAYMKDGVLTQDINVRYAVKADIREMEKQLRARCQAHGFEITMFDDNPPRYIPVDAPAVQIVDQTVAEFFGDSFHPFVMGGGTYARKLPNAIAFGPNTRFPSPYGDGHQPNEAIRVSDLITGIKVYILALLRLDGIV